MLIRNDEFQKSKDKNSVGRSSRSLIRNDEFHKNANFFPIPERLIDDLRDTTPMRHAIRIILFAFLKECTKIQLVQVVVGATAMRHPITTICGVVVTTQQ